MSNTKISDATKTTPLATDMIPLARVGSSASLSTRFQDISVVGTITTGTWNGTTIATSYGGTGVTTSTGSGANVLNVSPSLTTPAISGGTINNSVIGGTTPAAATVMSLTLGGYTNNKKIYQSADNYITILNGNPLYSDVTIDSGGSLGVRGNLTVYGSGSSIPGYLTTAVAASTYQPLLGYAAAHAGANNDITSLGGLTTALSVAQGGTGVTISSGANSVVLRDASANISTNAAFIGFTNIAAGASIILTTSSTPNYVVTGSGGQTFQLPSALTLPVGATFTFNNNQSSGAIAVNNNSATLVVSVPSGGYVTVTLLTKSFAAGTWDVHYSAPANVSWSTNTFNVPASITGATWNSTAVGLLYGGTGATTAAGARTNLGLGGAAVLNVGTTAGTVAAGDDSRIVNAISTPISEADTATPRSVQIITRDGPLYLRAMAPTLGDGDNWSAAWALAVAECLANNRELVLPTGIIYVPTNPGGTISGDTITAPLLSMAGQVLRIRGAGRGNTILRAKAAARGSTSALISWPILRLIGGGTGRVEMADLTIDGGVAPNLAGGAPTFAYASDLSDIAAVDALARATACCPVELVDMARVELERVEVTRHQSARDNRVVANDPTSPGWLGCIGRTGPLAVIRAETLLTRSLRVTYPTYREGPQFIDCANWRHVDFEYEGPMTVPALSDAGASVGLSTPLSQFGPTTGDGEMVAPRIARSGGSAMNIGGAGSMRVIGGWIKGRIVSSTAGNPAAPSVPGEGNIGSGIDFGSEHQERFYGDTHPPMDDVICRGTDFRDLIRYSLRCARRTTELVWPQNVRFENNTFYNVWVGPEVFGADAAQIVGNNIRRVWRQAESVDTAGLAIRVGDITTLQLANNTADGSDQVAWAYPSGYVEAYPVGDPKYGYNQDVPSGPRFGRQGCNLQRVGRVTGGGNTWIGFRDAAVFYNVASVGEDGIYGDVSLSGDRIVMRDTSGVLINGAVSIDNAPGNDPAAYAPMQLGRGSTRRILRANLADITVDGVPLAGTAAAASIYTVAAQVEGVVGLTRGLPTDGQTYRDLLATFDAFNGDGSGAGARTVARMSVRAGPSNGRGGFIDLETCANDDSPAARFRITEAGGMVLLPAQASGTAARTREAVEVWQDAAGATWICTSAGTVFATQLSGITATADGSATIVLNTSADTRPADYLTIGGTLRRVLTVSGTTLALDGTVGASSGLAVLYAVPTIGQLRTADGQMGALVTLGTGEVNQVLDGSLGKLAFWSHDGSSALAGIAATVEGIAGWSNGRGGGLRGMVRSGMGALQEAWRFPEHGGALVLPPSSVAPVARMTGEAWTDATTGKYWQCTSAGTVFATQLSGVTATADGSNSVTLSSATNVTPGQYLTVGGTKRRVMTLSGSVAVLDGTVGAGSGLAVLYAVPTLRQVGFGQQRGLGSGMIVAPDVRAVTTTQTVLANTMYLCPIYVPRAGSIDRLYVSIGTQAVGLCRLCLYGDHQTDLSLAALLGECTQDLDLNQAATDLFGTFASNPAVEEGRYWIGATFSAATATPITFGATSLLGGGFAVLAGAHLASSAGRTGSGFQTTKLSRSLTYVSGSAFAPALLGAVSFGNNAPASPVLQARMV